VTVTRIGFREFTREGIPPIHNPNDPTSQRSRFLNSSWGVVQVANPVVQLFRVRSEDDDSGLDPLIAQYMGALRRDRTGRVWAARPFAPEVPTSQWHAQLGAMVSLRR